MARDILQKECHLPVARTRFTVGRTHWPLSIVCFEDSSRWGYFDAQFYQIGLNARLAGTVSDATLRDILRHELAHYLCRIYYGDSQRTPHDEAFQETCRRFGWSADVARAGGPLPSLEKITDLRSQAVIEKVKKLLALADSANPHEAELATLKANQLILKYHIERSELATDTELCVVTLIQQAKKSSLMVAIYEILTHFLVKPMLFFGKSQVRLEAVGTRAQTELARYISDFLEAELPRLWLAKSRSQGLKGLRAKNSFFLGVAQGFSEKLSRGRDDWSPSDSRALVRVERELEVLTERFLGGLSKSYSGQVLDPRALESGKSEGRNLSIRPAVKSSSAALLLK